MRRQKYSISSSFEKPVEMTEDIEVVVKDRKSTEQNIQPMVKFSWLMGVGIARPGDYRRTTICIKVFHFLMCSLIIAYGVIDFFKFGSELPSEMFKIMYYMNKAVMYVTSYYYVFIGLIHYNMWPKFMDKVESLDRKMRREITIDTRTTRIQQISALTLIIFFGPLMLLAHVFYYYFTDPSRIYASDLLLYYVIGQSLTMNLTFDIIIYIIYQRFRMVNILVKQIADVYTAPWVVLKIQRLREFHYGICQLVSMINSIHGIHLLLSSANAFMMVVATLFRIYIGVVDLNVSFILVNNLIWIIYAVQFAVNCYFCSFTTREAATMGILVHEVSLKNCQIGKRRSFGNSAGNRRSLSYQPEAKSYEGNFVQNEILTFSCQIQQIKVEFSACGFFELNNALLQGFIGVITTYLIILVQFYESPSKGAEDELITTIADFTTPYTENFTNFTSSFD